METGDYNYDLEYLRMIAIIDLSNAAINIITMILTIILYEMIAIYIISAVMFAASVGLLGFTIWRYRRLPRLSIAEIITDFGLLLFAIVMYICIRSYAYIIICNAVRLIISIAIIRFRVDCDGKLNVIPV